MGAEMGMGKWENGQGISRHNNARKITHAQAHTGDAPRRWLTVSKRSFKLKRTFEINLNANVTVVCPPSRQDRWF
jgi:hypothetical protein